MLNKNFNFKERDMEEKKTCSCGPDCTCGCNEGKPCTCGCSDEKNCSCGCKCGENCKCGKGMTRIFSALLIGAGLCAGGFFPGYYYYQTKMNSNYVTVKGLSEMPVRADLAVWDLKFVVTNNDLSIAQQEIAQKAQTIIAFLKEQGFTDDEIVAESINTNDLMANPYRSDGAATSRYILNQTIKVRSQKVDLVAQSLGKTGSLIARGVVFDNQYGSPVSYVFTKLNEIKPKMLQEATENAEASAQEFAKSSNSAVGKIKYANQGVFSILPAEQTGGDSEASQIEKKVRVVSTIEYWLK